jgi:hypothetical protein
LQFDGDIRNWTTIILSGIITTLWGYPGTFFEFKTVPEAMQTVWVQPKSF